MKVLHLVASSRASLALLTALSFWLGFLFARSSPSRGQLFSSSFSHQLASTEHPHHLNQFLLQHELASLLLDPVQPVVIGVVGGSISGGHDRHLVQYHQQVVDWLNTYKPVAASTSRVKNGVTLKEHTLINRAMPATESDASALCLSSLFPGPLKPDLLLIEFGYNDAWMDGSEEADNDQEDDDGAGFVNHPAANVERMIRTALGWRTAVMLVEFSSMDGQTWRPQATMSSAGSAHFVAARHYGVPIVDLDFWFSRFAMPSLVPEFKLYSSSELVHPSTNGHAIAATLILQEIEHHISLVKPDTRVKASDTFSSAWKHARGLPYHGVDALPPTTGPEPELQEALFAKATLEYNCRLPRINRTKGPEEYFGDALVQADDWTWGTDVRDGGKTRSPSRPGFVSRSAGRPLVFKISPPMPPNHSSTGRTKGDKVIKREPVVFYRRSWQNSGLALAWTGKTFDGTIFGQIPEDASVMLNGSWSMTNSQMAAKRVPLPPDYDSASGQPYYLFVENSGAVAFEQSEGVGEPYFKVYGYGV